MNQGEKICQSYKQDVQCFENIPSRFVFDGNIDDDCSFIFPSGYSMYIEEFILNDAGPDNFVLEDENHIGYTSKLEWEDRTQLYWQSLEKGHPLHKKAELRVSECIETLKVTHKKEIFEINFSQLIFIDDVI